MVILSVTQLALGLIQMGTVQQPIVIPATVMALARAVSIPEVKKALVRLVNTVTTEIPPAIRWQTAVRIHLDLIYVMAFVWLVTVLAVVPELTPELIRAMIVRLLTAAPAIVMAPELVPSIHLGKKELAAIVIIAMTAILLATQLLPELTRIMNVLQPIVIQETVMVPELVTSIQVVKKALAVPAITAMMPILTVI